MHVRRDSALPGGNGVPAVVRGPRAEPAADACHLVTATFSGGCFWCLQPPFDPLPGVMATTVGYTGGRKKHPTHEEVAAGRTGHAAAVQILYDPGRLSYAQLLEVFWHNIDPTTPNRQFCARGAQYRPSIFYHGETQKHVAEASRQTVASWQRFTGRIATRITPASEFYSAVPEYQQCYRKHPQCYAHYRYACGREQHLLVLWEGTPAICCPVLSSG